MHIDKIAIILEDMVLDTRAYPKVSDWVDNEINNNKNIKHSLRRNTKGYGGKTH
jgi:hypothetical protein